MIYRLFIQHCEVSRRLQLKVEELEREEDGMSMQLVDNVFVEGEK